MEYLVLMVSISTQWISKNAIWLSPMLGFIATSAAAYAAFLSRKGINAQLISRRLEMQPVFGLTSIEVNAIVDDNGRYALYMSFTNLGNGPARVLVVDSDRPDIQTHIGVPISVASGGTTEVKLWLEHKDREEFIRLSLYYWDVEDRCYRTEVALYVTYVRILETGGAYARWRIETDRTREITKKSLPEKVMQWPRDILFHKSNGGSLTRDIKRLCSETGFLA